MSMTIRSAVYGASIFALAFSATAVVAEELPEAIIVTARQADEVSRLNVEATPGGAAFIKVEEFRDRLAVSLRDALAFTPGVYAQPRFGQEVRISVRGSGLSRGFHMRGLTLLQDGIPINLADDNGDFQELDLQIFDRIEIYRGGNALRYGGSTLGGAVNALTPTGRTAPSLEMRLDGGSFNTIRGKFAVAYSDQHGDAYLALTGDLSDGGRLHARRSALRFNGNVGLRLAETIETRFYASLNHINQDLPGALTREQALSTPKLSLPPNIANDQERNIDSIRIQNRTTVNLGNGTLTAGLFFNAKQLFHPIFQVIDQKSTDRGAFARLDLNRLGKLPVELTLGAMARFGDVDAKNFVNIGGERSAPVSDADQSARTLNAFGELRASLGRELTLVVGGVLTDGRRDVENFTVPSRGGSAEFTIFSPKLGLLYRPMESVQLFANVSRSVELPGFNELAQTPFSVGGTVPPGFVDLEPQRAWTLELGTRGRAGIAAFELSLYRSTIRGELLQFEQGVGIPAATFNADRTLHQGIEAGLELALAEWARLRQVYTLSDFRYRKDVRYGNNRLPVVPPHVYRADLRIGGDTLNVTPNIEWVPRGAWADYSNTTRSRGYVLLGMTAAASLRSDISVFADARNLAGKKAIGDISATTTATTASAIYYPVEGRAVYVGLRAKL